MRRGGNYNHTIQVAGPAFVVHRGVSQAKRKTAAEYRRLWEKKQKHIGGIAFSENGNEVTVTTSALRELRKKSLVIVSNPAAPQVWSPGRIAGKKSKLI